MRLVATSDFHGYLPEIPACDILLIAGDVTPVWDHGQEFQADWLSNEFTNWMIEAPAKHKVWIGGNHDLVLHKTLGQSLLNAYALPGRYLKDEVVEIEGLKIYGSPYSPKFGSWAFMEPDAMLATKWEAIPKDVDILMIHGPAYGVGDVTLHYTWPGEDPHVGSHSLRNQLSYGDWPNLKLFVSGHIHESYGRASVGTWTEANVSHVNEDYEPINEPMVFEI